MRLILLSGGSGKRLWPLSNEARSKQFLRLLPSPDGGRESMVQRVIRQIRESGLSCHYRHKHIPVTTKISFDYEVAEKAKSVAVVPYEGEWKDLGTWNTLTDELKERCIGNVVMDEKSENTHVVNELEIPVMCISAKNMVIAASCDGILVSDKAQSENIKHYADSLQRRPMYEERRWGEYKVVDTAEFSDGYKSLTKQLKIKAGKGISYQVHRHRDEVWTFIDGDGLLVLDGVVSSIGRGDTVHIKKGVKHAVNAISDLTFIEVQSGDLLVEEDIERFDWEWS